MSSPSVLNTGSPAWPGLDSDTPLRGLATETSTQRVHRPRPRPSCRHVSATPLQGYLAHTKVPPARTYLAHTKLPPARTFFYERGARVEHAHQARHDAAAHVPGDTLPCRMGHSPV